MSELPPFNIPGWLWFPEETHKVCDDLFTGPSARLIMWHIQRLAPTGYRNLAEDVFNSLYVFLRERGFPDFDPRKGEFFTQYFRNKRIYYLCRNEWNKLVRPKDAVTDEIDDTLPSSEKSADEKLILAEKRKALADCIEALPPKLRMPITLQLEGKSYEEIAELLKIKEGLVGKLIHLAKRALRECMKKKGFFQ